MWFGVGSRLGLSGRGGRGGPWWCATCLDPIPFPALGSTPGVSSVLCQQRSWCRPEETDWMPGDKGKKIKRIFTYFSWAIWLPPSPTQHVVHALSASLHAMGWQGMWSGCQLIPVTLQDGWILPPPMLLSRKKLIPTNKKTSLSHFKFKLLKACSKPWDVYVQ